MQPSTHDSTCTAVHSCPFAEWIVDSVSQSSSRYGAPASALVAAGGSSVSSVRKRSRDAYVSATRRSASRSRARLSGSS